MCREDVYTSYCSGAVGRVFWAGGDWGALPGPVSGTVGGRWGVWGSSLKNGVFLIVPKQQNSVNAAGTPHTAAFGRLRSSDKPLRATEFCCFGAIRNITVFSNGSQNTPPPPTVPETGLGNAPQSPPAQKARPQPRNSNSYRLDYT